MQVHGHNGINWIDRASDEMFRKALLDGAPDSVRPKIREALAAIPDKGAAAHSRRYFGAALPTILARTAPLIDELEVTIASYLGLPGFKNWLTLTGFANDYRTIKAMAAWAETVYDRETKEKAEGGESGMSPGG